jgi:hypothetical protein
MLLSTQIKIVIYLRINSQHSSASFTTRLQARIPKSEAQFRTKTEIFLLTTPFKLGMWSNEVTTKWVLGAPSPVLKWSGHEAHCSPQSNNKDKNGVTPPLCGPGSSVGIATGYGLDGPGIESRWERDFSHVSRPALGHTQPPVQWVPGLSRG